MRLTFLKAGLASVFLLVCIADNAAQVRTGLVTSTRANLRETPSATGQVKQEVPVGSEIKVLDNKGAWYVVRIADSVGWMNGNTFRFADSSTAPETPTLSTPRAPADRSGSAVPSTPARARAQAQPSSSSESITTSTSSKGYIRGPRGGCYYYGRSGRKVYVDRSLCN